MVYLDFVHTHKCMHACTHTQIQHTYTCTHVQWVNCSNKFGLHQSKTEEYSLKRLQALFGKCLSTDFCDIFSTCHLATACMHLSHSQQTINMLQLIVIDQMCSIITVELWKYHIILWFINKCKCFKTTNALIYISNKHFKISA